MKMPKCWPVAAIATALATPAFAAGNLLANGSFETPATSSGSFGIFNPGSDLGVWTVTGAPVATLHDLYAEPQVTVGAQSGLASLDITGAGNSVSGGVRQVVTLASADHDLNFYVGNIGGGTAGNQGFYTLPASAQLLINGANIGT